MKRLFFSITLVLLIPASHVFASSHVSLFMANWVKFSSNDIPQELPAITITDNGGGNITAAHEISIILPKDTEILWDRSVNQITFNGNPVSVSYSKNLKNLNIPISKTFLAGEQAVITGHKVRIYDRAAGYQNLTLDVNSDGVSDATGVNGVQIDDANKRTDVLAPYSPSALSLKRDAVSIVLSWENPPDPDLYNVILTRIITHAGSSTSISTDISIDRLTTTYTDTVFQPGDKIEYSLRAKDNVNNLSEPAVASVVIPLPEPEPPQEPLTPVLEDVPSAPLEEDVIIEEKKSILDSITEEDINDTITKYTDISRDTQYLKELVYFVKAGVIKGKKGKIRFKRPLTYGKFSTFLGKTFSIKRKGSYFRSLKLLGYIPSTVKARTKIKRKKAFKILLRLKGIDYATQTIVASNTLKGNTTLADFASWSVRLIDQGNQGS